MREKEQSYEQIELFKATLEQAIEEMLDPEMAEFLFDRPKPIDPYSYTEGFDQPTLIELDDKIKQAAADVIRKRFHLNSQESREKNKIRSYAATLQPGEDVNHPGEIQIEVFLTDVPNIYLQELTYSDGDVAWLIGPDQDI